MRRDATEPSRQGDDVLPDDETPARHAAVSEIGRAARAEPLERLDPGEGEYAEDDFLTRQYEATMTTDELQPGEVTDDRVFETTILGAG